MHRPVTGQVSAMLLVFNGKWCEEGVMITHTPLLEEAEAFSVPWSQPLCQGLKGKAQNRDSGVWGRS